jgi:hypothetical protein
MLRIRFTRRKEARRLTLTGWLLVIVLIVFSSRYLLLHLGDYLTVNRQVNAKVLVIEGYLPDYALLQAMNAYRTGEYDYIVTTGIPFTNGMGFCAYLNYADLARSRLIQLGVDSMRVWSVPTHESFRDRTYASALALRQWMLLRNNQIPDFNLYSLGAHARRSWYLYRLAFRHDGNKIGVLSAPDLSYDSTRWWTSSKGFRTVPVEALGYFYVRFFFKPY